ncbi:MAG: hypothetical protein AB3N28_08630 [Kordiimonas sp.]
MSKLDNVKLSGVRPGLSYKCPECNGTGFVFALRDNPLKHMGVFTSCWGGDETCECGVCGGDGLVEPHDFGGNFEQSPIEDLGAWYLEEKRKQIRHKRR